MRSELTLTALPPTTTAMLVHDCELSPDQQRRIMLLEYENGCLKQAMSELMMEKLLLKLALEARYQSAAPYQPGPALITTDGVEPGILGKQLRVAYEDLVNAPVPDPIAELIKKLDKEQPSSVGRILWEITAKRFARRVGRPSD